MAERLWLALILILFAALGVIYAIVTPPFEASDELWHYPLVKHLADGNALPAQVFNPDRAGPWKQEASQPPLYYYLAAGLTFWIETDDIDQVRWLNPHVDAGEITEDGNTNLVVHDPSANQWQGTALAVHLIRLASVLLGTATVYLTYRIAREAVPGRPEISLGAAAVNAFLPMFIFITGSVNNDNLVIPLASLALLLIIQFTGDPAIQEAEKGDVLKMILLGLVIGLGALTKITALGLIPLALFGIFIGQWKRRRRLSGEQSYWNMATETLWRFVLVLVPVFLIAGWWYIRNIRLYDDWTGWNAFIAVLGQRETPANLAQLWDERWGFLNSYWGLFGGLNVPMPVLIYRLFNILLLFSFAGFILYIVQRIRFWLASRADFGKKIGDIARAGIDFFADNAAIVLCILWAAAVVLGLIRWATVTWSSQGRLVFSAISGLSTLFVIGLVAWMPSRISRIAVIPIAIFMFVVSTAAPFLWIKPAYELARQESAGLTEVDVNFADVMRLTGYSLEPRQLFPGEKAEVALEWEVLAETQRDWSIFVHLNDPTVDLVTAQRDMYPGQGLLSTRLLEDGQQLLERYVLDIPDTAIAPSVLELTVGLYDYRTGDRLITMDGEDAVVLAEASIERRAGETPNALSVNFENLFELAGFEIDMRRVRPGQSAEVILYWRPIKSIADNYSFFIQLVGEDTTRWASQDLNLETSQWSKGELEEVHFSLLVDEETPAGVYPLIVGIYTRSEDGSFNRLQRLTDDGRLTDDFLELTKIRVDPAAGT